MPSSLLDTFSVGMGPFGRFGGSKFRCGSQISISLSWFEPLVFLSQKTKLLCANNHMKHPTKHACCVIHLVSRICFSIQGKVHIAKMRIFRNVELPHFCTVFAATCGTLETKTNGPPGPVFKVYGTSWPVLRFRWLEIFGSGFVTKTAGFYHVVSVSVVPSVSVESAMESNDVLMTCFCAVSLCGTL